MRAVLASDPLVLAVGETHALRGARAPSAARQFAKEILPMLEGRASDLLVELMMPPSGCADASAKARAEQEPITSRQAEGDQGDYVAMGERARTLGIVPDMLRPTCADMEAIGAAGDETVDVSLRTIARLTATQAARLVARDARSSVDREKVVVIYGGALHNDLPPPAGSSLVRPEWSYAPAVDAVAGGRLIALDLIVPEYIGDDATWRSLPWWPHFDRRRQAGKVTLFRTGERSYTLILRPSQPEQGLERDR
jgi:hypothetical protein